MPRGPPPRAHPQRRPYAEHSARTLYQYRLTETCGAETEPRFVCTNCDGDIDPREIEPVTAPLPAAS